MLKIYTHLLTLKNDTKGATAVEYGMIIALIAALIISGVGLIGDDLKVAFDGIAADLPDT